jgi:hypothetical protein
MNELTKWRILRFICSSPYRTRTRTRTRNRPSVTLLRTLIKLVVNSCIKDAYRYYQLYTLNGISDLSF